MVKANKASLAMRLGLGVALAFGSTGCSPKTMSIEQALNEANMVYVSKTGEILTNMDAMEAYAKDFESNSVGNRNLYFPNMHLPLKKGMVLDGITKDGKGYSMEFVNKDTTESQTFHFKRK